VSLSVVLYSVSIPVSFSSTTVSVPSGPGPITVTLQTQTPAFNTDFISLTDTPASYTGQAGRVVAVNSGESGLEFIVGGATTWGSITGILTSQSDLNSALNARLLASAVSAFGLTLIDDADAAAARTTMGLGGAATLNVGTTGGTVAAGDDARLSDARTPTSHTHGNITNAGAIGSTSGVPIITGASGVLQAGSFGTTAGTFCQGNDARLAAQTITLTGDVTGSGTGSFTATIANGVVTFSKMQDISGQHLMGRHAGGTGSPQEVTVGSGIEFQGSGIRRSALTGDVTASAGSNTTTIANDAVTYAKIQNVSATDRLLGRSTAGAGDVEEITCTAAGRALLDDVNAAAQRTTLEVPTVYSGTSPPSGGTGVDGDLFFRY